jgi:hypothetical protein
MDPVLPRIWKCNICNTLLISNLDIETFMRIPDFKDCPICRDGTLKKVKENATQEDWLCE